MSTWHDELVAAANPENKPIATKEGWMPVSAVKHVKRPKRKINHDDFPCHAQQRAKERLGIFLPKEELKVMAELIELGQGVSLGRNAYLLRYGKHIFHVIYDAKIKRIKTIYPQDKVAGLIIGTVPREELRKLIG